MKLIILMVIALTITRCAAPADYTPDSNDSEPNSQSLSRLSFFQQNWPDDATPIAQIYGVTIPPNSPINVAVSEGLQTVEEFAAEYNASAVLNGGFFDPNNAQTTSFVTVNGTLVADPRENRRLVDNADLADYMNQILNRSEFRRYQCVGGIRYDITFHHAELPTNCTLHSALGAGPQLLPTDTSQIEGFTDYANGKLIRDAIGSHQRNARSAIGIKQDGTVVWIMIAQVQQSGGMTLEELTKLMESLDVQKALNLDGGSSSSLHVPAFGVEYQGQANTEGNAVKRPVKSVLLILENMTD